MRAFGVCVALGLAMGATRADSEPRCARAEASAISEVKALPALARKLDAGAPIRIVALGSSSTEGTPDIARDAIYPAVLGRELSASLHASVEVINKGKGGEDVFAMAARLERDVFSQKPDLVVWQLGANDVLQRDGVAGPIARIQQVLDEFRLREMPVVLVDLQAGPAFDRDKDTEVMQAAIERASERNGVMHFHRQALMRRLIDLKAAEMPDLVLKDGIHMSALAHQCTGQLLARQIARASLMRRANVAATEMRGRE